MKTLVRRLVLFSALVLAAGAGTLVVAGAAEEPEGEHWVCPMHPQVQADAPGRCPICKMNLVERPLPPPTEAPDAAATANATEAAKTPEPAPAKPEAKPASKRRQPAAPAKPPSPPPRASAKSGPPKAAAPEPKPAAPTTLWTCSMHPQILEDAAGTCSVCGMDLVPKTLEPEAPARARAEPRRILYWVAPMDPSYRRDGPGKSPMGMDLVPVYADEGEGTTVRIDPVVVQNMGVRTALVQRGDLTRAIRTVGQVEVAEDRLAVVNLRYSGWVERLHVNETGVRVTTGQPLFDLYSPELSSAQEEYLLALRGAGPSSALAKSARRRLELFGLKPWQVKQIEQKGAQATLTVTAPRTGYVVHKNVVDGARVMEGTDLYRIADLTTVWVEAEVYEFDAPWVVVGAPATVSLTFQAGRRFAGRVSYVYPTLNPSSRTLRVRIELENPELRMKPGMFATVEIESRREEGVLVIPTEAVIHSGVRELVFVALDLGRYEAREIRTGLSGDRYRTEILEGLSEGERVVTSGQFLLDSESQLQEAVQKLMADRLHAKTPGVTPAAKAPDTPASTYWTCPMHPHIVEDVPGSCPICGMDLVEKKR